jgi:hypothetical protein
VTIQFQREGVSRVQTVTMPRTVVSFKFAMSSWPHSMGKPQDGIRYIQVTGFASNIRVKKCAKQFWVLQRATEVASNGERYSFWTCVGIRVDCSCLQSMWLRSWCQREVTLYPQRAGAFPECSIGVASIPFALEPSTKLAVLVNGGTALAAEIVFCPAQFKIWTWA